jgi:predicted nucleic acid-binding protein
MLVLDASIALAWGLPDESTEHAQSVLAEVNSTGARVPSLWITEVLNGVLMAERRKRLTVQEGERFLATLATLHRRRKIQIAETQPARAFARVGPLARDHRLTAYDATYLLLAQRAALPLATTDRALVSAATEAGVKIWSVPRR